MCCCEAKIIYLCEAKRLYNVVFLPYNSYMVNETRNEKRFFLAVTPDDNSQLTLESHSMENQFQFIGNLTRDPEVKITAGNKTVATIDIAVNTGYIDGNGEKKEVANFFRIEAWDKLGAAAGKNLAKGKGIIVTGHMKNNNYEVEGKTVYGIAFVAERIKYL